MAATARVGRWAIWVVAGVLLATAVAAGALPVDPTAKADRPVVPSSTAVCLGNLPSTGVRGQLTIDGGPLPANADAGLELNYSYEVPYRLVYASNGSVFSGGCSAFAGTVVTSANGSFAFVPPDPNDTCNGSGPSEVCVEYLLPQAPVSVGLAAGVPAGYVVTDTGFYTPIAVGVVYQAASVTIAPAGPAVVTSVGAPTSFAAALWAANGTPSLVEPTDRWSLNGTGWSFVGSSTDPTARVLAVAGAGVGVLSVLAETTAQGVALSPVSASVDLVAIPTEVNAGSANRTVVDVGEPITYAFSATGAPGFNYSAFVQPGLGRPAAPASCEAGPAEGGTVVLNCSASLRYPDPGTAQPTANVTNGYSSSTWRFPDVIVTPAPELEVLPGSPVGYALEPLPVTVAFANGSGATPFARACLAPGSGATVCEESPGPTWTFDPTYQAPGNFSAVAWAIDADGTNATVTFPVTVVPPLTIGPIEPGSANATVGSADTLTATVAGGALPARFWWNVSGSAGPLFDGELTEDATVNATLVPNASGPVDVTLTVVDRLGTVVARELVVTVGPAAADLVVELNTPPAGPVVVGTPVSLTWGAFGPTGAPDRSFGAAVELTLNSSAGPPLAWVNASGAGALDPIADGRYGVPATAWLGGVLNVSVTIGTAARVVVGLAGASLPAPVPSVNLTLTADLSNVRLFAPEVAHSGARTNATLWQVSDRFGNPAPGARLTVSLSFGGVQDARLVVAVPLTSGGAGAWINYSAPSDGNGEVTVTDAAGSVVLGPLDVPPAPAAALPLPTTVDTVATVVPIGAAGAAAFAVVRRRRRARVPATEEEELRRLAEGRVRIVELVRRAGAADLAGLESAWTPRPVPADLAEWVASLVADGTLSATMSPDGKARFCLATSDRGAALRPTVDAEALERSLEWRDAELGSGSGPGSPERPG